MTLRNFFESFVSRKEENHSTLLLSDTSASPCDLLVSALCAESIAAGAFIAVDLEKDLTEFLPYLQKTNVPSETLAKNTAFLTIDHIDLMTTSKALIDLISDKIASFSAHSSTVLVYFSVSSFLGMSLLSETDILKTIIHTQNLLNKTTKRSILVLRLHQDTDASCLLSDHLAHMASIVVSVRALMSSAKGMQLHICPVDAFSTQKLTLMFHDNGQVELYKY